MDTQLAEIMKAIETHSDKQEVVTKLITVMNSLGMNLFSLWNSFFFLI